jgi:nicotinate-nucleotide--dimethylbenzimidazole phosphoribosyltransferase
MSNPEQTAQAHWNQRTKPQGALGRLETAIVDLARIQGRCPPLLDAVHALIFAGDHGAVESGVSAWPSAITQAMVQNMQAGGAAISVLARRVGFHLQVIDAGVGANGTANYLHQPAMTEARLNEALALGQASVDALERCDLLILGEMGIGNTASASLLMHCLTHLPLSECVGAGAGLAESGLAGKLALLEQARARRPERLSPEEALTEFGGAEIAAMVGALLAAADRGWPVLVDGFIVTAAVLVAQRLKPSLSENLLFAHVSDERAHAAMLQSLSAQPLLDLGLRLGEGSGAALAVPLLRSALALFEEMAGLEDLAL